MKNELRSTLLRVPSGVRAIAFAMAFALASIAGAADGDARVLHTDIHLSLDPDRGLIRQDVELQLAGSGSMRLSFALSDDLVVERSRADRGIVEHRRGEDRLVLLLDPPLDGERVVSMTITGRPQRGSDDLVTDRWAVLGADDLWYPVLPGSLATARIRVEAPEGWAVLGPGRPSGEGTDWNASRPVRGLALAAAPALALTSARLPGTEFRLLAPEGVSAADLAESFRDPMAWFSGALAPYGFDGFNLALVPGFHHHMRGSGVVVAPASTPRNTRQDAAALLAGQWFGERLAGSGTWIRAFEAWQAVTYARDRSLPLPTEIAELRDRYLELPASRDVPLSRTTPASPDAVVRGKGSAAPDMIRLIVGNRRFFRALEDLFAGDPGPPLAIERFRAAFEARAGNPLVRAFSEWFDRRGLPRLTAELETRPVSDDTWNARLTLTQRDGVWLLPVEVAFVGLDREHRETIRVENETTTVEYALPFEPARVEIDPLHRLFLRP